MYLTNAQIRTRARRLLDDNIFGKDWLKSALLSTITDIILIVISSCLISLSNKFIDPFLNSVIQDPSILFVTEILLYLLDILFMFIPVGPIMVGLAAVHIDLVRGSGAIRITNFFYGFKNIIDNLQIGFMYALHIALWSLLGGFPGIYVAYSYSMAFYIKRDNPEYTWRECFDESERIMEGNRWRLFKLHCNFIGWYMLGALFAGIGLLWVIPYASVSTAVFYEEARLSKE